MSFLNKIVRRAFSTASSQPKLVELKPLPYDLGALEPVISGEIMDFHYGKHHRTYVNNLNSLNQQSSEALSSGDIKTYISLANALKFNGGGHLNHELFWESLAPIKKGGGELPDPSSKLR